MHACSGSLSASYRSPHRMSGLNSSAGMAGIVSGPGVGATVGAVVGIGVDVGAAVGAGIDAAVGETDEVVSVPAGAGLPSEASVAVGSVSSPHAVTKATASRPISPINASRLSECLMRPLRVSSTPDGRCDFRCTYLVSHSKRNAGQAGLSSRRWFGEDEVGIMGTGRETATGTEIAIARAFDL